MLSAVEIPLHDASISIILCGLPETYPSFKRNKTHSISKSLNIKTGSSKPFLKVLAN